MQLDPSSRARAGGGVASGSLTAVMLAAQPMAAPNVPLVLRIGVVRGGRIVEERVIKQRTTVSIGETEDATFVVPSPRFELFVRRKEGYALRFDAKATGRVSLDDAVVGLEVLRARGAAANGVTEVPLTEGSRGKIVIGETTFLFQFVQPPPPQPRPQLPLSVKGGIANQIDWSLTIIAALSFLLHFGVVGAMYSDWMDVVVDDHHSVAGLVDLVKSIPPPAVTESPVDPTTPAETPSETTPTKTTSHTTTTTSSPSTSQGGPKRSGLNEKQVASLVEQANQMEVGLLLGRSGKSATEDALRRSEIPPVDLSARAASSEGVVRGGSELHVNGGTTSVASRAHGGLTTLGGDGHANADSNAGPARVVAAPKVEAQIGSLGGGINVSGADRVIAGLRGRFRACYQKGLNVDSTMSGKVVISAKIGPNGEVTSADVASSSGLSPEVNACITSAVKRAQFDAQASSTSLTIPVSFVKQ